MSQAATSTAPEDEFVCLFSEVFGLEKSQLLVPELGFVDVTGGERRIDYAIKATEGDVAFEIDGPFHYDSNLITVAQYENDLLRQNSLITCGWRVFRWTDRQLREEPEQVKEQRPSRRSTTPPGTGKTIIAIDDAKSLGPARFTWPIRGAWSSKRGTGSSSSGPNPVRGCGLAGYTMTRASMA